VIETSWGLKRFVGKVWQELKGEREGKERGKTMNGLYIALVGLVRAPYLVVSYGIGCSLVLVFQDNAVSLAVEEDCMTVWEHS